MWCNAWIGVFSNDRIYQAHTSVHQYTCMVWPFPRARYIRFTVSVMTIIVNPRRSTVKSPHITVPYVLVYLHRLHLLCICYLYETTQSTELQIVCTPSWFTSVVDANTFGTCHGRTIRGIIPGPCRMTTWRVVSNHIILQLVPDLCAMCECVAYIYRGFCQL